MLTGVTIVGRSSAPVEGRHLGIKRQGETGYVTAILQVLFHSPEFVAKLFEERSDPGGSPAIRACVQQIFLDLHNKNSQGLSISTLLRSFGWSLHERDHHDAAEMLAVFINAIDPSLFDLFTFTASTATACKTNTNDVHINATPSVTGSLCVPVKRSLSESLVSYFKPFPCWDGLDDTQPCSECGNVPNVIYSALDPADPPSLLVLQLHRAYLEFTTMTVNKNPELVALSSVIDLAPYEAATMEQQTRAFLSGNDPADNFGEWYRDGVAWEEFETAPDHKTLYELYAVVCHQGMGSRRGHWRVLIKTFPDREWFAFDNDTVSPAPADWADFIGDSVDSIPQESEADGDGDDEPVFVNGLQDILSEAYLLFYRPFLTSPPSLKTLAARVVGEYGLAEEADFNLPAELSEFVDEVLSRPNAMQNHLPWDSYSIAEEDAEAAQVHAAN